jgi:phage shock protein PspC (stress-responsive transcriptional regulator)
MTEHDGIFRSCHQGKPFAYLLPPQGNSGESLVVANMPIPHPELMTTPAVQAEPPDAAKASIPAGWPFARAHRGNLAFGVLAGIAWRIGIYPTWARLIFIFGAVFGMTAAHSMIGVVTYFVLALLMPVVDSSQNGYGLENKFRVPIWLLVAIFSFIVAPTVVIAFVVPLLYNWPSSFGYMSQLVFGAGVIIVGVALLFGRQRVFSRPTSDTSNAPLTTAAYGAGTAQLPKVHMLHRSSANIAVRLSFALALLMLSFDSGLFIYALAMGLVIAAGIAIATRTTRKVAISLAVVSALVAGLAASTGINNQTFLFSAGNYEYRYVGSNDDSPFPHRKSWTQDLNQGFVSGFSTVHVEAPDDSKIVFDGRMTAGKIVVRNVDAQGNVISEMSSQSGWWTTKKQTYGNGGQELHVKVHGGVGRIVLEIDRSE